MSVPVFEERLLGELRHMVATGALAAARPRRRVSLRLALVVLAVLLLAGAGVAGATIAVRHFFTDPHKATIVQKLETNGVIGPLAASAGTWKLYIDAEPADNPAGLISAQISSPDLSANGYFSASSALWANAITEGAGGVVYGHVDLRKVAAVTLDLGGAPRPVTLGANGYFMQELTSRDLPTVAGARVRVVARGPDGAVVAVQRVSSG